jgi:hypothetical protein
MVVRYMLYCTECPTIRTVHVTKKKNERINIAHLGPRLNVLVGRRFSVDKIFQSSDQVINKVGLLVLWHHSSQLIHNRLAYLVRSSCSLPLSSTYNDA